MFWGTGFENRGWGLGWVKTALLCEVELELSSELDEISLCLFCLSPLFGENSSSVIRGFMNCASDVGFSLGWTFIENDVLWLL